MPKYEQVVISFAGKPLIVQRKVETVREMMQAGREADETRIAEGDAGRLSQRAAQPSGCRLARSVLQETRTVTWRR